jgi:hypothetical protein
MTPCEHEWGPDFWSHGCHYNVNVHQCLKCGTWEESTPRRELTERTFDPNGYDVLRMDPENCERCRELLNGPRPTLEPTLFGDVQPLAPTWLLPEPTPEELRLMEETP